jgi:NAD(P)-dependent dehydrogenase (short-subunit alcohol dehydrogenase family)
MTRILITGANRGIGLEIVRQYANLDTNHIFATCRQPDAAADLQALAADHVGRITILPLDVTDPSSIGAAAAAVADQVDGLDLLINNAGINPPGETQTFDAIDADQLLFVLQVNAAGPLLVAQAFAELLRAGVRPVIVNVSSQMGSLQRGMSSGYYGYRSSKAALNMITRCMAADLRSAGVLVVTVHPGWVQTDMGGSNATLTPVESAQGLIALFDGLTTADTGGFFNWDGSPHPW